MSRGKWAMVLTVVAMLAAVVAVCAAEDAINAVRGQRYDLVDGRGSIRASLRLNTEGDPELVTYAEDGTQDGEIRLSTLVASQWKTPTPPVSGTVLMPPWPQVPTPPDTTQSPPSPAIPSAQSLVPPPAADPSYGQYWYLKNKRDADPAWVKRLEEIHPSWTHHACEMIGQHRIWIGMTSEQVRESWGNPEGNTTSTGRAGTLEQWRYPSINKFWSGVSGAKPQVSYLNFENGVLASVQMSQ